jgi:hypothetical protein
MTISRYNEQAVASTALIHAGIKEQLSYVKANLPKEDIVLEVGVERASEVGKVHEVATLHLDYSNQTTIRLKICVHKEEQVMRRQLSGLDAPCQTMTLLNQGTRELAAPINFHMMNSQTIQEL